MGVLVKKSLNLISFPPIPSNFGGMKIWGFKEIKRNECSLYSFHSLPFKLPNKVIDFSFLSLKLPNKRREEYFKIILFILFHFILFPHSKRGLNYFFRLVVFLFKEIIIFYKSRESIPYQKPFWFSYKNEILRYQLI